MTINHKVSYYLKGKDFLEKKSTGLAGDLNGLFYRENDQFSIYALYGLRRADYYQVVAHEIAHAWMTEYSVREVPLEINEGFAQWVAYKALGNFGYTEFRKKMLDGNSLYATGLRKMLDIENAGGQNSVFAYLKKHYR